MEFKCGVDAAAARGWGFSTGGYHLFGVTTWPSSSHLAESVVVTAGGAYHDQPSALSTRDQGAQRG